ncbi:DUF4238 domain-containing protein [Aliagarivorans taiwanensis]|uniref:DUF4238 domain-containing protein n=1 Tax=Aliagarivorans taiwanensis TaxID=561966 RepID=UPI00040CDD00|nr:DUF4238 domain-containing protein [Aliagarivorans taiwanensis]
MPDATPPFNFNLTDLTTDVRRQHTVPRFLLHNFAEDRRRGPRQLFTFDKQSGRSFRQSVNDATTRRTFYNLEDHPQRWSLEPLLGQIESQASEVIRKIIQEQCLTNLTDNERIQLAVFAAVQRSRTFANLVTIETFHRSLQDKLAAIGAAAEDIPAILGSSTGENSDQQAELKNFFLQSILSQAEHARHFLDKSWVLIQNPTSTAFYISDNPITMHNSNDFGPYGNIGLAVPGIQIHLPLSSTLTLAFYCPTIRDKALEARRHLQHIVATNTHLIRHLERSPREIIEHAKAHLDGTPVPCSKENAIFLNHLQVTWAEQYLFCQDDNFDLIRRMIADNPGYTTGLRPQIS